jgi:AhpD family alkylhydroperoxidase
MEPRIDYVKTAPGVRTAMSSFEEYVHKSGLERSLLELVKLRASLINGCACCADMHTKIARSLGETEQRLYTVSLWSETPFFLNVSARRSPGPRRSHASPWNMSRAKCTNSRENSSARGNWSISRWQLWLSMAGTV